MGLPPSRAQGEEEVLALADMDGPDAYSKVERLAVDVGDSGELYVLTWFRQLSTGYVDATVHP